MKKRIAIARVGLSLEAIFAFALLGSAGFLVLVIFPVAMYVSYERVSTHTPAPALPPEIVVPEPEPVYELPDTPIYPVGTTKPAVLIEAASPASEPTPARAMRVASPSRTAYGEIVNAAPRTSSSTPR